MFPPLWEHIERQRPFRVKTAFILGAGQIGSVVAERLACGGWNVTVASRGRTPLPAAMAGQGIVAVTLDRADTAALAAALGNGADLVVDTIAYDDTHADQLIALESGVGAFAVISSAIVYADGDGMTLEDARSGPFPSLPVPIREDQRTVDPGPESYATRKAALERRLLDRATRPVAILRPCAVHGAHSPHPREYWFVKRLLDGRTHIPLAYSGESRFQTSATVNIAALIEAVADKSFTGPLNIPDPDAPSVREIGATLMAIVGREAECVPVPGDAYPPKMGVTPWSIPKTFILDDTAARAIGYRPVAGYATAVAPTCRWMIETAKARDWRDAFPVFATYSDDPFDYAAEDRWLAERKTDR